MLSEAKSQPKLGTEPKKLMELNGKKIMMAGAGQVVLILKGSKKWEELEVEFSKKLNKDWTKTQRETAKCWLKDIWEIKEFEKRHNIEFFYNPEDEKVYFR
jgi:hypothetical protein